MIGAIIGDVLGSVHEKIPHHKQRSILQPTDDTILTCACFEWCNNITKEQLKNLDLEDVQETLYKNAVDVLKKWANKYPEDSGFSKRFTSWAKESGYDNKVADTNGCIMRSSPISALAHANKLHPQYRNMLLNIFCKTTHDHISSYEACEVHSHVITHCLSNTNHNNFKKFIDAYYPNRVLPVEHWINTAKNTKGNFIWTAQESLDIALSALYFNSDFEGMMEFFIKISGDVDTYAAIAGPIAQCIYDIHLEKSQVETILRTSLDTRHSEICSLYCKMNSMKI